MNDEEFEEFSNAYAVIMKVIDTRPNTRPLFHKLVNLMLQIIEEEDRWLCKYCEIPFGICICDQ